MLQVNEEIHFSVRGGGVKLRKTENDKEFLTKTERYQKTTIKLRPVNVLTSTRIVLIMPCQC